MEESTEAYGCVWLWVFFIFTYLLIILFLFCFLYIYIFQNYIPSPSSPLSPLPRYNNLDATIDILDEPTDLQQDDESQIPLLNRLQSVGQRETVGLDSSSEVYLAKKHPYKVQYLYIHTYIHKNSFSLTFPFPLPSSLRFLFAESQKHNFEEQKKNRFYFLPQKFIMLLRLFVGCRSGQFIEGFFKFYFFIYFFLVLFCFVLFCCVCFLFCFLTNHSQQIDLMTSNFSKKKWKKNLKDKEEREQKECQNFQKENMKKKLILWEWEKDYKNIWTNY